MAREQLAPSVGGDHFAGACVADLLDRDSRDHFRKPYSKVVRGLDVDQRTVDRRDEVEHTLAARAANERWKFLQALGLTHNTDGALFVHGSPRDPTMEYVLRSDCIDLTGAVSVDPTFCNEVVKLIAAIRLLGAQGIVVGIQAETARHIVATGLDLSQIRTLATLREALTHCRVA